MEKLKSLIMTLLLLFSFSFPIEAADMNTSPEDMTLREKIGQMMFVTVPGKELSPTEKKYLTEHNYGGVILFAYNAESREQLKRLTKEIQRDNELPLFIATDEEGGYVSHLSDVVAAHPSQEKIGSTGNRNEAARWASATARELKALGLNMNLAPVADLGTGNERSFGKNPDMVADMVRASIAAYSEEGLLCCLKHYPGLGRAVTDTHKDKAIVNDSQETIYRTDMIPFAIATYYEDDDSYLIMVSHAMYTAFDDQPADFSPVLVEKVLRHDMRYDGIIVTDDLGMGAIGKHYTAGEAAVKAIKAGVDMVMVCHSQEKQEEVYEAILKGVESGELTEERIDESIDRIIRVKGKIKMS